MKITKNKYLAAFALTVFLLAVIRLFFPSVAESRGCESGNRGSEGTEVRGYENRGYGGTEVRGYENSLSADSNLAPSHPRTPAPSINSPLNDTSPLHYQYKGRYIMTAVKSGLMVIDQHRAHVRILYEEYTRKGAGQHNMQKLLFPEVVQFPPSDIVMLRKVMPLMEQLGFELTDLGGGSYALAAVPAGLDGINPVTLVHDMMATVKDTDGQLTDIVTEALSLSLAQSAAIPYGQVLSNDEMENLVNRLFACANVNYTPDGKAILCILPQGDIEHLLG